MFGLAMYFRMTGNQQVGPIVAALQAMSILDGAFGRPLSLVLNVVEKADGLRVLLLVNRSVRDSSQPVRKPPRHSVAAGHQGRGLRVPRQASYAVGNFFPGVDPRGSDVEREPSEPSTRGPAGSSVGPRGSSLRRTGSSLDPSGSPVRRTGSSLDPSGSSVCRAGSSLDPSGSSVRRAGSSVDPAGSSLDPRRRTLDPSGSSLDPRGRTDDPSGSSLDPRRRRLDPSGSSLDPRRCTVSHSRRA